MNKYSEVMEYITVTDEMREQIFDGLGKKIEDGKAYLEKKKWNRRVLRFAPVLIAAAAAVAVIIISPWDRGTIIDEDNVEEDAQIGADIVEFQSAEELSKEAGFPIGDLEHLPFEAEEATYILYWRNLAEITYLKGEQMVYYRKSIGDEDNSGDYNEYPSIWEEEISGANVTWKGDRDNNSATLAIWSKDGFSYSVFVSDGMEIEEFKELIMQLL